MNTVRAIELLTLSLCQVRKMELNIATFVTLYLYSDCCYHTFLLHLLNFQFCTQGRVLTALVWKIVKTVFLRSRFDQSSHGNLWKNILKNIFGIFKITNSNDKKYILSTFLLKNPDRKFNLPPSDDNHHHKTQSAYKLIRCNLISWYKLTSCFAWTLIIWELSFLIEGLKIGWNWSAKTTSCHW